MISLKFQIILIVITVFNLGFTIYHVNKMDMKVKYSLIWILYSICLLVLSIFPKLVYIFSVNIGIYDDTNTLFMVMIAFIYAIIFSYSIILTRISVKANKAIQEIAILKHDIKKFETKLNIIDENQ